MDLHGFTTIDEVGGEDDRKAKVSNCEPFPNSALDEIDQLNKILVDIDRNIMDNNLSQQSDKSELRIQSDESSNVNIMLSNLNSNESSRSIIACDSNSEIDKTNNSEHNLKESMTQRHILSESVNDVNDQSLISLAHENGTSGQQMVSSNDGITLAERDKVVHPNYLPKLVTDQNNEPKLSSCSCKDESLNSHLSDYKIDAKDVNTELAKKDLDAEGSEEDLNNDKAEKDVNTELAKKDLDAEGSEEDLNNDKAEKDVNTELAKKDLDAEGSEEDLNNDKAEKDVNTELAKKDLDAEGSEEDLNNDKAEKDVNTELAKKDLDAEGSEEDLNNDKAEKDVNTELAKKDLDAEGSEEDLNNYKAEKDVNIEKDLHTSLNNLDGISEFCDNENPESEQQSSENAIDNNRFTDNISLAFSIANIKEEPEDTNEFDFGNLMQDPAEEFNLDKFSIKMELPNIKQEESSPVMDIEISGCLNVVPKSEPVDEDGKFEPNPHTCYRIEDNLLYSKEKICAAILMSQSSLSKTIDMNMFWDLPKNTMPITLLYKLEYLADDLQIIPFRDKDLLSSFFSNYGCDPKRWKKLFHIKRKYTKKNGKGPDELVKLDACDANNKKRKYTKRKGLELDMDGDDDELLTEEAKQEKKKRKYQKRSVFSESEAVQEYLTAFARTEACFESDFSDCIDFDGFKNDVVCEDIKVVNLKEKVSHYQSLVSEENKAKKVKVSHYQSLVSEENKAKKLVKTNSRNYLDCPEIIQKKCKLKNYFRNVEDCLSNSKPISDSEIPHKNKERKNDSFVISNSDRKSKKKFKLSTCFVELDKISLDKTLKDYRSTSQIDTSQTAGGETKCNAKSVSNDAFDKLLVPGVSASKMSSGDQKEPFISGDNDDAAFSDSSSIDFDEDLTAQLKQIELFLTSPDKETTTKSGLNKAFENSVYDKKYLIRANSDRLHLESNLKSRIGSKECKVEKIVDDPKLEETPHKGIEETPHRGIEVGLVKVKPCQILLHDIAKKKKYYKFVNDAKKMLHVEQLPKVNIKEEVEKKSNKDNEIKKLSDKEGEMEKKRNKDKEGDKKSDDKEGDKKSDDGIVGEVKSTKDSEIVKKKTDKDNEIKITSILQPVNSVSKEMSRHGFEESLKKIMDKPKSKLHKGAAPNKLSSSGKVDNTVLDVEKTKKLSENETSKANTRAVENKEDVKKLTCYKFPPSPPPAVIVDTKLGRESETSDELPIFGAAFRIPKKAVSEKDKIKAKEEPKSLLSRKEVLPVSYSYSMTARRGIPERITDRSEGRRPPCDRSEGRGLQSGASNRVDSASYGRNNFVELQQESNVFPANNDVSHMIKMYLLNEFTTAMEDFKPQYTRGIPLLPTDLGVRPNISFCSDPRVTQSEFLIPDGDSADKQLPSDTHIEQQVLKSYSTSEVKVAEKQESNDDTKGVRNDDTKSVRNDDTKGLRNTSMTESQRKADLLKKVTALDRKGRIKMYMRYKAYYNRAKHRYNSDPSDIKFSEAKQRRYKELHHWRKMYYDLKILFWELKKSEVEISAEEKSSVLNVQENMPASLTKSTPTQSENNLGSIFKSTPSLSEDLPARLPKSSPLGNNEAEEKKINTGKVTVSPRKASPSGHHQAPEVHDNHSPPYFDEPYSPPDDDPDAPYSPTGSPIMGKKVENLSSTKSSDTPYLSLDRRIELAQLQESGKENESKVPAVPSQSPDFSGELYSPSNPTEWQEAYDSEGRSRHSSSNSHLLVENVCGSFLSDLSIEAKEAFMNTKMQMTQIESNANPLDAVSESGSDIPTISHSGGMVVPSNIQCLYPSPTNVTSLSPNLLFNNPLMGVATTLAHPPVLSKPSRPFGVVVDSEEKENLPMVHLSSIGLSLAAALLLPPPPPPPPSFCPEVVDITPSHNAEETKEDNSGKSSFNTLINDFFDKWEAPSESTSRVQPEFEVIYSNVKGNAAEEEVDKLTCLVELLNLHHYAKVNENEWAKITTYSASLEEGFLLEKSTFYRDPPLAQGLLDKVAKVPLVGLEYVLEVQKDARPSVDSNSYICSLCSKKMSPATLVAHVKSVPHRLKYAEYHSFAIFIRFGKLEVKQWTGQLVKQFTTALEELEKNKGRKQMPVVKESKMNSAIAFLKNKIPKKMSDVADAMKNGDRNQQVKMGSARDVAVVDLAKSPPHLAPSSSRRVSPPRQRRGSSPHPRMGSSPHPRRGSSPHPRMGSSPHPRMGSSPHPRRGSSPRPRRGSSPRPRRGSSPHPPRRGSPPRPYRRDNERNRDVVSPSSVRDHDSGRPREYSGGDYHRKDHKGSPNWRGTGGRRSRSRSRSPMRFGTRFEEERAQDKLRQFRLDESKLRVIHFQQLDKYMEDPGSHPLYKTEWDKFWGRRSLELEKGGIDPQVHDLEPEWFPFWKKRIQQLCDNELQFLRKDLLQKYKINDPDKPKQLPSTANSSNMEETSSPNIGKSGSPLEAELGLNEFGMRKLPGKNYDSEYMAVGTLKLLASLEDQLGSLASATKEMFKKAMNITARGEDPKSLFHDCDNIGLLKLVIVKLNSQVNSGIFGAMESARTQVAIESANWLLKEAESLTKPLPSHMFGLDIGAVAKATLGLNSVEIAQYITEQLVYVSRSDPNENELQGMLSAISAYHLKLRTIGKPPTSFNQEQPQQITTAAAAPALFPSGVLKPKEPQRSPYSASASQGLKPSESGLALLQSSYECRMRDMDSLSLNELQDFLKNFRNLDPSMQDSLTEYLKKLEATDSKKVTKLRAMMHETRSVPSRPQDIDFGRSLNSASDDKYRNVMRRPNSPPPEGARPGFSGYRPTAPPPADYRRGGSSPFVSESFRDKPQQPTSAFSQKPRLPNYQRPY